MTKEEHQSGPGGAFSDDDHNSTEYNLAKENDQLERSLKSRHLQFLALGKFY